MLRKDVLYNSKMSFCTQISGKIKETGKITDTNNRYYFKGMQKGEET